MLGNSIRSFHLLSYSPRGQRLDLDRFGYGLPPAGSAPSASASGYDLALDPDNGNAYVFGRSSTCPAKAPYRPRP